MAPTDKSLTDGINKYLQHFIGKSYHTMAAWSATDKKGVLKKLGKHPDGSNIV